MPLRRGGWGRAKRAPSAARDDRPSRRRSCFDAKRECRGSTAAGLPGGSGRSATAAMRSFRPAPRWPAFFCTRWEVAPRLRPPCGISRSSRFGFHGRQTLLQRSEPRRQVSSTIGLASAPPSMNACRNVRRDEGDGWHRPANRYQLAVCSKVSPPVGNPLRAASMGQVLAEPRYRWRCCYNSR